jgi:hypothetical protein
MRRLVPALAVAAVAASCSRDLNLPTPNRLTLEPGFTTVAPRQRYALTALGGAGGYTYAFAQGGRLSGADATVDAVTGAYQAGSEGSAQDVVVVTDRTGSTAEARVTVTQRLVATPAEAYLSPGGALKMVVSGGEAPYAPALVRGAGSTGSLAGDTYTAGAEGDVVDRVRITDLTGDVAAVTTVVIHVGPRVRLYPPSASVAPREALAFVALGGDPSYVFTFAQIQSGAGAGAPTISPDGTYVAGTNPGGTPCTDVVRVIDALGQQADTPVLVGAPLALSLPVSTVDPGVPVQLVATGGKPPYTFSLLANGNRSAGRVDPASGIYTPGPNYGARDLLRVNDVTGTVAALASPPVVGARRVTARPRSWRCVVADVNGDGREDAVVLRWDPYDSSNVLDVAVLSEPWGLEPSTVTYWLPSALGNPRALAADLDGDGHDEIWLIAGTSAQPLVPDLSGQLTLGTARTLPSAFQASAAPIPGGLRFYTKETCTAVGPRNGIRVFDWMVGGAPGAASCVGLPWTTGRSIAQIAAGDVNGDGYPDVAWTEPVDSTASARRLLVAYGNAAGTFGVAPDASVPFPDPAGSSDWVSTELWMDPEGGLQVFPGGVGVYVGDAAHGNARAVALWHPGSSAAQVVDPFRAGSGWGSTTGFRVAGGMVVLWDDTKTTVAGFTWDPTGTPSFAARDVLPVPTPLQEGPGSICLADLDGDGTRDLVASSAASGTLSIYRGDGGGIYGQRARFEGPLSARTVALAGDVDGDGVADLVVGSEVPTLLVLWGGDHQLARAKETGLGLAPRALADGEWITSGARSVLVLDEGGNLRVHPISASGAIGAGTAFTLPSGLNLTSWTLDDALVPVRFDGDAGPGFWSVMGGTGAGINYYYPSFFVRDGPASFRMTAAYPPASGTYRCAVSAVGRGDGGGVVRTKDVVELCTSDHVRIDLWRAALSSRGPFTFAPCAYDDPVCSWGSAVTTQAGTGTAIAAGVTTAGRLADGAAVLVGNTGSAGTTAAAWALVVRSPTTDGAALTTTWVSLGAVAGTVESAAVGALDGDGYPDLALTAGGEVYVFRGSAADGTGSYTVTPAVPAAGRIVGIVPLAAGETAGDVLMISGDNLVTLVNDGAGNLR